MRQAESVLAMKKFMAAGIGLVASIWWLMGCAEVIVPGTMTGGGEYYRYTTSNIAKETLMGDVRDVTAAARSALKKMDWGGDNFHWFEGKRFGFFRADFGNDSEAFTQSFSCE
jgi:hypothetical protein